jgi:hypothetical protein
LVELPLRHAAASGAGAWYGRDPLVTTLEQLVAQREALVGTRSFDPVAAARLEHHERPRGSPIKQIRQPSCPKQISGQCSIRDDAKFQIQLTTT